jgi:Rps23 Pro-64 3,4-dihydroxylase Tpa1-like proline 4-hydroxylase
MLESSYELEQNVVAVETSVGITASNNAANIFLREQRHVVHSVIL